MWKTVKLGELYKVGSSKRVLKADWKEDGVPFYRGREITTLSAAGFVNNELFITEEHYQQLSEKSGVPTAGDIMITAIGTIGNTYIVEPNHKFYFKDASVLWLKRETEVSSEYIQYWLKTDGFYSQLDKGNGATVDTLTIKKLASVEITLPPLAEQQRIVAKLDAAFAEIDRAVEVEIYHKATTQQLRESTIIAKFSMLDDECEQLHLSDVCVDFTRGKPKHRPRNDERLYGDAIPFVQTGDVSNAKKYLSDYKKMYSEFGIEQSKQWSKGTVCITIAANIAELAILDMNACFPDSIIGALPDENITSSEYLFYLLNYFQKKIKAKSKGSAQQNINLATFSDETFPFPALERQKQIATELAELDASIDRIVEIKNEKVDALLALKTAILSQELQPSQSEAA